MRKKVGLSLLLACCLTALTAGAATMAYAASTQTQFFTENCVDDEIDSFIWDVSNDASTQVGMVGIGDAHYTIQGGAPQVIRTLNPITIPENGKVEFVTSVSNISLEGGLVLLYSGWSDRYDGDGVKLTDEKQTFVRSYLWPDGGTQCESVVNGNGVNTGWVVDGRGSSSDRSRFFVKATYGADGSYSYAMKNTADGSWSVFWSGEAGALTPIMTGYYSLAFDGNINPLKVLEQTATVYDSEGNATTVYTEDFLDDVDMAASAVKGYGQASFGDSVNYIMVDGGYEDGQGGYEIVPGNYGASTIRNAKPINMGENGSVTIETEITGINLAQSPVFIIMSWAEDYATDDCFSKNAPFYRLYLYPNDGGANSDWENKSTAQDESKLQGSWVATGYNFSSDRSRVWVKVTYGADGSAAYYMKHSANSDYGEPFRTVEAGGLKSITEGYFTLGVVNNAQAVVIKNQSVTITASELVEETVYDESFTALEGANAIAQTPYGDGTLAEDGGLTIAPGNYGASTIRNAEAIDIGASGTITVETEITGINTAQSPVFIIMSWAEDYAADDCFSKNAPFYRLYMYPNDGGTNSDWENKSTAQDESKLQGSFVATGYNFSSDRTHVWVKVTYGADGSAAYYMKHSASSDYGNPFRTVEAGGLKSITKGYFTIGVLNNAQPITVKNQKVTVLRATATSGAYTENFTNETKLNAIAQTPYGDGSIYTYNSLSTGNTDYVIKKTPITAPNPALSARLYEINTSLVIFNVSGRAKAQIFFTTDKETLENLSAINFYMKNGVITVNVGSVETALNVELGKSFDVSIYGNNDNVNEVYVNGVMVGEFEKELAGTYFGYRGVDLGGASVLKFGLTEVIGIKYSYSQGNGGDFEEDFTDGKYYNNIVITPKASEIGEDATISLGEEGLKFDFSGRDTCVSTVNKYGDFEFTVVVSSWDLPSSFGFFWDRTDFATQGKAIFYSHENNDFVILNDVGTYADGYGRWSSNHRFPNGEGTTSYFSDYDFSEGNLIFKLVRQGDVVSVYVYTENCAEDSYMRNNPFSRIENCYMAAGCIGFYALPTGEGKEGLNMTIASISVKNLDVEKAENLLVGDVETDKIYEEEDDTPIDDPTLNESTTESKEEISTSNGGSSSGCGGSIGGLGLAMVLPLALGSIFVAKKKED